MRKILASRGLTNKIGFDGLTGRNGLEPLESRLYMSVSQDANGWTVVTPSSGTRTIYVSTHGSNSNSGLSASAPVATFAQAYSLIRDNSADQILLERGDTFNDSFPNWDKSGISQQQPILIGTYGTGNRPLIDTGTNYGGWVTVASATVSNVDILGLQFYENDRDPNSPTFNTAAAGGGSAISDTSPGSNILIEDCSFSFYRNNVNLGGTVGPINNFTLRRDVDTYSWSTNSHSQGLYAFNVNGLTIDSCVFDHNGWNDQVPGAAQVGYNHNIYTAYNNTAVTVENSILANASFAGIMARAGGNIENNLFLNNSVALAYGQANGADSASGGVSGQITGNVIVGDKALGTLNYGQGFDIGNTNGVLVSNNVFTQDTQLAKDAIQLDPATGTYNPTQAVGENNLTISNNLVSGWYRSLNIDGRFQPGSTGLYGFSNVTITGNQFINDTNREFRQDGAITSAETITNNTYYTSHLTTANWFLLQSNATSASTWKSTYEPTAKILTAAPNYTDPNRSAATYDLTVGGAGSLADFLAHADQLSDTSFLTQFQALAMMNYVRAGFNLSSVSSAAPTNSVPPTAVAAISNVGASSLGTTSTTFTVTYTAEALLNTASLDSNDILVTGPNGFSQLAVFVGYSPLISSAAGVQSAIATYRFTPPGGTWSTDDAGTYSMVLLPNQVTDTIGTAAVGATLGTLSVDLTGPTAIASVSKVTDSDIGNSNYIFTITYTDPSGVDLTTLNSHEVEVTGPSSYDQIALLNFTSVTNNGDTVVATYTVAAPGNNWNSSADGTYSVALPANQIKDSLGNAMAGGVIASFSAALTTVAPPFSASISGTVFNDTNGNHLFDSRDTGIGGVVVYADLNLNGKFDPGEPNTTTNTNGQYTISGLAAGQYTLREETPAAYMCTIAAPTVTLANGQAASLINFSNQLIPTVLTLIPTATPSSGYSGRSPLYWLL